MATVHQLSRQDARRVAVRAQLLTSRRPPDLLTVVRRLTFLQLDPVSAVAPSADLVAFSRLGAPYRPDDLKAAIASQTIIELRAFLRPAEDFALYRAKMAAWPGAGELRDWQVFIREWVAANDKCRREILARLAAGGPLQSRELPDLCEKPWESTGWTNNKNVTRLLEFMVSRGEVAVAGRKGRERLWDLAERVYPSHPVLPSAEAGLERDRRRLAALGIARPSGPEAPMEPAVVGRPASRPRSRGSRARGALTRPTLTARPSRAARRCSPRSTAWSTTASARWRSSATTTSWRCTSRSRSAAGATTPCRSCTATSSSASSTPSPTARPASLTVNALHQDVPFTPEMSEAIAAEIASLAAWLGLEERRAG